MNILTRVKKKRRLYKNSKIRKRMFLIISRNNKTMVIQALILKLAGRFLISLKAFKTERLRSYRLDRRFRKR